MKVHTIPVVSQHKLFCDPEGTAVVHIRQASTGDQIILDSLFEEQTHVIEGEQMVIRRDWNFSEIVRERARLVMCGAAGIYGTNGEELFPTVTHPNGKMYINLTTEEFNRAWDLLPVEASDEINELMETVNPHWNVSDDGKKA